nr:NFACT family protein [Clostridia bacterium]
IAELAHKNGGGRDALWKAFCQVVDLILDRRFTPTLIKNPDGTPLEFCYMPITQYGNSAEVETVESFGKLVDRYYGERDKADRMRQRSADITKLLNNAVARIRKKTALQQADIAACAKKDEWKNTGELITANIWQLKRGMTTAEVTDYTADPPKQVKIVLDTRLTPAQNAQQYYKKYNKAKVTERELAKQIEKSMAELEYLDTVYDALTKAETEQDLGDIRAELYETGYLSRAKQGTGNQPKRANPKPLEFVSCGGHKLLCGKNNRQNDYISHRVAEPDDWWFHVKNAPGSHVILRANGDMPTDEELTEACELAAYYSSKSKDTGVAVDYTKAKNLKKPAGSAPGFVTYKTNQTAFVNPKLPK